MIGLALPACYLKKDNNGVGSFLKKDREFSENFLKKVFGTGMREAFCKKPLALRKNLLGKGYGGRKKIVGTDSIFTRIGASLTVILNEVKDLFAVRPPSSSSEPPRDSSLRSRMTRGGDRGSPKRTQ